jgi:molybdopterin-guanine dinucleotide biosynthesis protein A
MGDAPIAGIFVGGASRRMGRPKGRIPAPTDRGTILEHLVHVARVSGCEPVLVGDAAPYADLVPDVPRLADDPPGIGPLGGLAAHHPAPDPPHALTLACDMPHVDERALAELLAAPPAAGVVALRRGPDAPFEPMLALWHPPSVRLALEEALAAGVRSFQPILAAHATERPLTPALERALVDWDTPDDLGR